MIYLLFFLELEEVSREGRNFNEKTGGAKHLYFFLVILFATIIKNIIYGLMVIHNINLLNYGKYKLYIL